MNKNLVSITFITGMIALVSCRSHYEVADIQRSRILVDARYDARPDAQAAEFMKPYKHVVDSIMGPVVGRSAKYMTAKRPEGTLSNLLADIMVWAAKDYNEQPDLGIYNMGGVRADLPKGEITYGDVLDIAPFENKIAFTTLSGTDLLELFSQMANVGGEGVSHSVRMVISKDGKLVSVTVNGEPVDPARDYRITTIDYLLGGTDKMEAFKKGRNVNSPQEVSNNTRFIIMNYFRDLTRQGKEADAEIEGRVKVKE
ncbi:MAG: 5'-nucleotidase C-terminal domain-containing protein [Prevotella sp.]|nr:5'-nucleotidase C-terminal domain-containing protein [Prevotella sp.]